MQEAEEHFELYPNRDHQYLFFTANDIIIQYYHLMYNQGNKTFTRELVLLH